MNTYDVIIIGSGPGGYVCALRAAQLGLKTACIEQGAVGGTCLNIGCIPTKALIRSAEVLNVIKNSGGLGIRIDGVQGDWPTAMLRSKKIAAQLSKGVEFLFKKYNVTLIKGMATFKSNTVVTVLSDGITTDYTAANIVIASGSVPRSLPGITIDHTTIITSDDALHMEDLPKSLIILGGGAIGCEFAYIFHHFGVDVTLIEALPHLLPLEDEDISRTLEREFKKQKIKFLTNTRAGNVTITAQGVSIITNTEGKEPSTIEAAKMLVAVGRAVNTESLSLDKAGIAVENGFITINEKYSTAVRGIFAIGDVAGSPLLAHKAQHEGYRLAEVLAGKSPRPLAYTLIPKVTYCNPQVASIGLCETEAAEKGEVIVRTFSFKANGKAMAMGESAGLVKLVADAKTDVILGVHVVGPEAGEIIHAYAVAMSSGMTTSEFGNVIMAHPTLSESLLEVAHKIHDAGVHD